MEDTDTNIINPDAPNKQISSEQTNGHDLAQDLDQKLTVSSTPQESEPVIKEEQNGFGVSTAMKIGTVDTEPAETEGLNFTTDRPGDSDSKNNEEEKVDSERPQPSANITSSTPSAPTQTKSKSKSKYFDSIETMEMTRQMMELQQEDPEEFKALMMVGNDLIKYGETNDVASFHENLLKCKNTNFLFWHASKAFKKALDNFNKEMVEYMFKTLQVDITHEVFNFILHYFITRCINISEEASQQRYAAEILELLVKYRKGKVSIDEMDPSHENITALQMCCKYGLFELAKVILKYETPDVNSVDTNDKTPLGLVKLRSMKAQLDENQEMIDGLKELIGILEDRGAVIDWRKAAK